MRVFVVGGINIDITGTSGVQIKPKEKNPGRATMLPGGVARNIAENLVRMNVEVELVAPFGDDMFSETLKQNCRDAGIGLDYSVFVEGRSGIYLSVTDYDDELYAAVSDMDIMEELDDKHIAGIVDEINKADACVIEANLGIDAIEYIAEHVTVPIIADPVSITKAEKLRGVLPKLFAIKPNKTEASALTGIDLSTEAGLLVAAEMLVESGVKRAFVSLGPEGMVYADGLEVGTVSPKRVHVESTKGAGDSATAALCYGVMAGLNAHDCAVLSCKAAELTIQIEERVNKDIDIEKLLEEDDDDVPVDDLPVPEL